MIELKGIYRRWGDFSLKDVNLKIETGEYFVLLGPSGSGKTLLLETTAGLHYPEKGEIWLNDRNVTNLPPERRNVGFVYQEYCLFPHLSVAENIRYGLNYRKITEQEKTQRLEKLIELLEMRPLLARREPNLLSGGERQKVALARALAIEPEVLLLDEPVRSLDYSSRELVFKVLRDVNRRLKITIIHVTHDHTEAAALADRIAVLNDGAVAQIGDVRDVFWHPQSLFVAKFLGIENIFAGECRRIKDNVALINIGSIAIKAVTQREDGQVNLCIRPEDINISQVKPELDNTFLATIKEISDRGIWVRLEAWVNTTKFVVLVKSDTFYEIGGTVGAQAYIGFPASTVHTF